jgi:hypothetical protein
MKAIRQSAGDAALTRVFADENPMLQGFSERDRQSRNALTSINVVTSRAGTH